MKNWTLTGHGRLPWSTALELLTGTTCAWTDLDGPHLGPPPTTTPVGTTHLWAWADGRALRLRIDDEFAYVAELAHDGPGEPVTVIIHPELRLWAPADEQAGPIPETAHTLDWELLELPGPGPVSFVVAHPKKS
ncbi:hypothetical protein [Rhizohabitans arisaemae]|uniref:hypothetical protein n=1 Tax=Rhizohabitans arisaemae TaxID=2720610 RepID=UPI0024B09989|nr:hypothetical protein [Rhizohabitans arisaemae]